MNEQPTEFNHEWTDDPVCPKCGRIEHDAWEYHLADGDKAESKCESCGTKYEITCCISVDYSTKIIED